MFSLSTRSLQELRTTTNTAHRYIELRDEWRHLKHPLLKDTDGNLHSGRFDRDTVRIAVNDRVMALPVLTGLAFANRHRQTAVTVLDDERLPLVLDYQVAGEAFRIRYTRISFPNGGALERRLATDRRVDVYGIYFDFGSDRLRPESTPVLAEIGGVLARNGDWTLRIDGHTDAVGGDSSNLALSRRRSEAVRRALVERYRVDPARLLTAGYGASRPKDTNDTPEGRSRNRRVELVRP
jgi:outer membrane protein OmpA-like peptidoglycan-associated protein